MCTHHKYNLHTPQMLKAQPMSQTHWNKSSDETPSDVFAPTHKPSRFSSINRCCLTRSFTVAPAIHHKR